MKKITLLAGCIGVIAVVLAGASELGPTKTLHTMQSFLRVERQAPPQRVIPPTGELSQEQIEIILQEESVTNLRQGEGQWLFDYRGRTMAVLNSAQHDRMRIIAPITEVNALDAETLQKMLTANFHSALDGRYAIGNGVVYAAFLHPRSTLQAEDFRSALRQVGELVRTFGSTYSSGGLSFGAPAPAGPLDDLPEI